MEPKNETKIEMKWVAKCTCGWQGFPQTEMMDAVQDGKDHEQLFNTPFNPTHFTHPELIHDPFFGKEEQQLT